MGNVPDHHPSRYQPEPEHRSPTGRGWMIAWTVVLIIIVVLVTVGCQTFADPAGSLAR